MKKRETKVALVYSIKTLESETFKKELKNIDAVVLPEMILGGYAIFKEEPGFFITKDEPLLAELLEYSRKHNVLLLPGTFPLGNSAKNRKNVSLAMYKGKFISEYEKIHLFRPMNEHKLFQPGKYSDNFAVKFGGSKVRFGSIICFDLRFPELARKRAIDGLDILLVQAWWPKERDNIWKTLLCARAIENQIFVVGVNAQNDPKCGKSYVFDPYGNEVMPIVKKNDFAVCNIDLNIISEIKSLYDNIKSAKLLNEITK